MEYPNPTGKGRPGRVAAAAGAVVFVSVLLGLFYGDPTIRHWAQSIRTPMGDLAMRFFTQAGLGLWEGTGAVCLMAAGYYLKRERHLQAGKAGLYAVILGGVTVQGVKHLVGRPRPRLIDGGIHEWGPSLVSGHDSFPSGHAVTAFAMAVVLSRAYPSGRVVFFTAAALIGVSRVYLDSHFASDVFAGAVLGAGVGTLLCLRLFPKPVHLL